MSDLAEAWEVWKPSAERFDTSGEVVLASGITQLRGKGSGVELSMEWGQVFHLRDGKVIWARIYADREAARAEFERRSSE
jgi:ketosteroid isomerase-like protein